MQFVVRMKADVRGLRALNTLAERTFRRGKMLVYRAVVLALAAWAVWTAWNALSAGISFTGVCKTVVALFLLAAGLAPNTLSAWFSQASMIPDGTLTFDQDGFVESGGGRRVRRCYSDIDALMRFRGYDFIFLDKQRSLILSPEHYTLGDAAGLRAFLEEKTGKTFQSV